MIKRIFAVSIYLTSISAIACSKAPATDDPTFCTEFKKVAYCYCVDSAPFSALCPPDMKALHQQMKGFFQSQENACRYQQDVKHYTSFQDCMDNWNCYHLGGIDSRGRACNRTTLPCERF